MHVRQLQPLRQILEQTRASWDCDQVPAYVRTNFAKVLACKTEKLGGEVYRSESEERIFYHTCKSRACPSCGNRATKQWQRERWAALPDIPFVAVVLTMPEELWPTFQENHHLLHDLPALGAAALQEWAKANYGVRLLITVIPHTFGARLNYHPHLHILISAGGLREADSSWVNRIGLNKYGIMRLWREAIILYLLGAVTARIIKSPLCATELKELVEVQSRRQWHVYIDREASKAYFLGYVGRYFRRPPIAQRRIRKVTDREVIFEGKDRKTRQPFELCVPVVAFVRALALHVPEHYWHGIRYFGLLAPRSNSQLLDAIFALLAQKRRQKPARISWAYSLRKSFGVDPLRDGTGSKMHWVGRLSAR